MVHDILKNMVGQNFREETVGGAEARAYRVAL